jgi:hypothetical protein
LANDLELKLRCNLCKESFKRAIPLQKYCSVTCSKAAGDEEYLQVRAALDLRLQEAVGNALVRAKEESGSEGR